MQFALAPSKPKCDALPMPRDDDRDGDALLLFLSTDEIKALQDNNDTPPIAEARALGEFFAGKPGSSTSPVAV